MNLINSGQTSASSSSATNSPVNISNAASSSSSSSSTTAHETDDSGRHSMSDSPSSNPPTDLPTAPADLYSVKLVKTSASPNVPAATAGTFTSKCTLSSGNSITLSQTVQNVLSPKQHTILSKRPISRSSSKDSGLLYTQHSSIKTSPSPVGSAILTASCITAANGGLGKNNSATSINLNKF